MKASPAYKWVDRLSFKEDKAVLYWTIFLKPQILKAHMCATPPCVCVYVCVRERENNLRHWFLVSTLCIHTSWTGGFLGFSCLTLMHWYYRQARHRLALVEPWASELRLSCLYGMRSHFIHWAVPWPLCWAICNVFVLSLILLVINLCNSYIYTYVQVCHM